MKKGILKIAAVVLGGALVLGLVVPSVVAAKGPDREQLQAQLCPPGQTINIIQGRVASIAQDGNSFVVQKADESQVTVTVDSNTKYFIGTGLSPAQKNKIQEQLNKVQEKLKRLQRGLGMKWGQVPCNDIAAAAGEPGMMGSLRSVKPGAFTDLAVGQAVVVRMMPNEALAKQVLILKALPLAAVSGTVSAVGDHTFTVTKADSTTVVLTWDGDTRFVIRGYASLQVGQTVNALYNSDTKLAKVVKVNPPAPPATASSTTSA